MPDDFHYCSPPYVFNYIYLFIHSFIFIHHVCVHGIHMFYSMHVEGRGNLQELVIYFYHVAQTQLSRFGSKHIYLCSHLISLFFETWSLPRNCWPASSKKPLCSSHCPQDPQGHNYRHMWPYTTSVIWVLEIWPCVLYFFFFVWPIPPIVLWWFGFASPYWWVMLTTSFICLLDKRRCTKVIW